MSSLIRSNDLVFLLELLAEREERGLLGALQEDPEDQSTRNAYVDYLLDKDRNQSAELIKNGYTPGVEPRPRASILGSGAIASGQIGVYQITSGVIRSGS